MAISRDIFSSDSSGTGFAVSASRTDERDDDALLDVTRWRDSWSFAASAGGQPESRWRALYPEDVYSDPRPDPESYPAPFLEIGTSAPDIPLDLVRPDRWTDLFQDVWNRRENISVTEARAVVMQARHRCRTTADRSTMAIGLCDNM